MSSVDDVVVMSTGLFYLGDFFFFFLLKPDLQVYMECIEMQVFTRLRLDCGNCRAVYLSLDSD